MQSQTAFAPPFHDLSQESIARLFDALPLPMAYYDCDFRIQLATKVWLDTWGSSLAQVSGSGVRAVFTTSVDDEFAKHLEHARSGRVVSAQRYRDASLGAPGWYENHFVPHLGPRGEVLGMFVYSTTIDWYKRYELEMQALSAVSAGSKNPWAYIGEDERYHFVNEAYAQTIGKPAGSILGQRWDAIVGDDALAASRLAIKRAFEGTASSYDRVRTHQTTLETRWIRADVAPHFDPKSGKVIGVYLHAQDIHDLKVASEALEQANWRVNAHLDQSLMPLIEWQSNGKILRWSNKASETFGSPSNNHDALASLLRVISPQDSERIGHQFEALIKGEVPSIEFVARCHDAQGQLLWCDWHCTALRDRDNETVSYMAFVNDVTETIEAGERLERLAKVDALTSLPNRIALESHVVTAIINARSVNSRLAVLFLDLDRFKVINDTLGHRIGDLILVAFAARVRTTIKERDIIARHGGDEFIVVLSDFSNESAPALAAERILQALRAPFDIEGRSLYLGASIGYALFPDHGEAADELFRHADAAMYLAKLAGRNRYMRYEPAHEQKQQRLIAIEQGLRKALADQTLDVYYQPCISFKNRKIIAVEALARWNAPGIGSVSPAQFIQAAEDIGLIHELGFYVLMRACAFAARFPALTVGVNVSVLQLQEPNFAERVRRCVLDAGCRPEQIELEMTESRDFADGTLFETVTRLHTQFKINFAIDDFGTGYSNLTHLRKLPIHTLKIDRSFVHDIASDAQSRAIVDSTVTLAHGLSMRVVAEGIETQEQHQILHVLGCDAYQGYLFSPAVTSAAIEKMLIEQSTASLG